MHIIHTRVRPCIQYQNGVAENSHEKQRQEHYDKIPAKQILHGTLLEYQVCQSTSSSKVLALKYTTTNTASPP